MRGPQARLIACALLFSPVGALDITLKGVQCDESLSIYVEGKILRLECDGQPRCTLGSDAILKGKLTFLSVDDVGLVDGYVFISANLDFRSTSFQLLRYLQAPICGDYVSKDANAEDACPADGVYEVHIPYVLPEEETKAIWLASGWEGIGEISIYSEANNIQSMIGTCQLYFSTAVTAQNGNSIFLKLPIPSAMLSILVLLTFSSFLVLSCLFRLMIEMATGKKRKGGLGDDSTGGTLLSSTEFKKLEDKSSY